MTYKLRENRVSVCFIDLDCMLICSRYTINTLKINSDSHHTRSALLWKASEGLACEANTPPPPFPKAWFSPLDWKGQKLLFPGQEEMGLGDQAEAGLGSGAGPELA